MTTRNFFTLGRIVISSACVMACVNASVFAASPSVPAVLAAATPDTDTSGTGEVTFIVVGDTPYSDKDEVMLGKAIPKVKEGDFPFVIHIGDYKGGGKPCTADHDVRHQELISSLSPLPVIYTPGDNEWTDCDRFEDPETGERYSDLDRLARVRELFFSERIKNTEGLDFRQQETLPENAAWSHGGVHFLTLHVTGTNNGRDWVTGDPLNEAKTAVEARDVANQEWLAGEAAHASEKGARALVIAMQADPTDIEDKPADIMCTDVAASNKHPCDAFTDLRAQIRDVALAFERPVIVIHGDTAPFTLNQSFAGEEAPNLWRLNAAGDAGVGRTGFPYGVRDVTHVTITPEADQPVEAFGLVTGKKPKRR
ncbi:MAG: metallophosphoesterase [Pseudomonadota bacterium]